MNELKAICPFCHDKVFFQHRHAANYDGQSVSIYQCPECQQFVTQQNVDGKWQFLPPKQTEQISNLIPEDVRKDFREALLCFSIQAFKASVSMCRRALEKACKNRGAKQEKLVNMLKELADNGEITARMHSWATEVRLLGNYGAHPEDDGLDDVSEEEAQDVIHFLKQITEDLYVTPSLAEESKKRRESKGSSA